MKSLPPTVPYLKGTIRISKRLRTNSVWERPDYGYCWVDLLMLTNDQDRDVFIQGEKFQIRRGQLAWSLRSLEKEWKKSGEWVARFLRFLTDDGMVTVDSNRRRTIITVVNYEAYNPVSTDTETDTETVTEPGSEPEQKVEGGIGKWKGERASAPHPEHFPEIPDEQIIQSFCGDYLDLARGVERGIPEVWWRGWFSSKVNGRAPFPRDWKRALTAAFTADLVARHPKALASGRLDSAKPLNGQENKKNGGRTDAQARFETSRELEAVRERLDACHDIGTEPNLADVKREKELKAALAALDKEGH